MRTVAVLSFAFALFTATLAGCATPGKAADDIAQLTRQADAWDRAIVARDRAAIEANMADDFRQIDVQGNVEAKASFVEGLTDPLLVLDPYRVDEFEIRLHGDTALLSGRIRFTGRYGGKPFVNEARYIDIYVRRAGAWKVVSVQMSPLKPR